MKSIENPGVDLDTELKLGKKSKHENEEAQEEEQLRKMSNRCILINQSNYFANLLSEHSATPERSLEMCEASEEKSCDLLIDMLTPTYFGCFWRFAGFNNLANGHFRFPSDQLAFTRSGNFNVNGPVDPNFRIARAKLLRDLFEISNYFEVKSLNEAIACEMAYRAHDFTIADLARLGDNYRNEKVLDAAFRLLDRASAKQLVANQANWINYDVNTKNRLLISLEKLL